MSPLVRSLLALACAALLRAACAQSLCHSDEKEPYSGKEITLPIISINASLGYEINFYIIDNCQYLYGLVLEGEIAVACDENVAPNIFVICAILACAAARPQQHGHEHEHAHAYSSQSIQRHDVPGKAPAGHHEHYAHPKYEFEYQVKDPHTGDIKSQHESRDGDVVKGYYSLHEADGTVRIVHYSSDKKSGFHADVKHEGHAKHIEPKHHH